MNIDWWKTFCNAIPIFFFIVGYFAGGNDANMKLEAFKSECHKTAKNP